MFNPFKIIGMAGRLAESGEHFAELAARFGEGRLMELIDGAKSAVDAGMSVERAAQDALIELFPDEAALIPDAVATAVAEVGDMGIEWVIVFAGIALL